MKLADAIFTCFAVLAALSLATAASAQINQPPVITSAGGGASAELSAAAPLLITQPGNNPTTLPEPAQNHVYVIRPITVLTAIDVDQDEVSFSVGGVDMANFAAVTGVPGLSGLVLVWVVDVDTKGTNDPSDNTTSFVPDANGDGVFEVTVQASDGRGGSDTQALSIHFPSVANQPPQGSFVPAYRQHRSRLGGLAGRRFHPRCHYGPDQ